VIISGYSDFSEIISGFNSKVVQKFLSKPWDNEELVGLVHALRRAVWEPRQGEENFHGMLTSSPVMKKLFKNIIKFSMASVPVFINGETGVGKELVASSLHAYSDRSEKPFICFNCANFSKELMESQLFGHTKGAFTGAVSDQKGLFDEVKGGTLFFDEVTSMPLELQAKLLRVLQEREYSPVGSFKARKFDAQIISASNVSLKEAVARGEFREDLRYRLEVLPLFIPPLRERIEDIALLINFFASELGKNINLSSEVLKRLGDYSWPGNVRQLENLVMYLCAISEGSVIELEDIPAEYLESDKAAGSIEKASDFNLDDIQKVLEENDFNKSKAAQQLGISRMTLYRYLKALEI
jgi:DNA-binding NtrC family response regulator